MGFFSDLFDPMPSQIKDIRKWLEAISTLPEIKEEAMFYLRNEKNWPRAIEQIDEDKTAEQFAWFYIYRGSRDLLLRGNYHIFFGIMAGEGHLALGVCLDAIDRLVALKFCIPEDGETLKNEVKSKIQCIG